ncbi:hypothetical protein WPS_05660 [Vulcanimicrobium alpinum]|uniref:Uncharacterized protein n=1 Tax=Vulcanimicrobium alpinum TaxID=3016050 RepID=A0AAN1XUK1_UNVUL|nr:hypothetical protein WPS_05660 [Vulcanimicrobium alpinum]
MLIVAMAAGAAVGFAGAFTGGRLVKSGAIHLAGWSDALALVLALFFIATGLAFAIGGRSRA